MTKAVFKAVADHLEARGALLRGGIIVDATLIAASPSTKNAAGQRDPEMRSSKKGNQWYFGVKAHIGADSRSGLVHTVGVTSGSVHDATVMDRLVRDDDSAESNLSWGQSNLASLLNGSLRKRRSLRR